MSYGAANNLNQYVTVGQGASPSVTLTHDANGNLTGEGTWAFAYDAENRLRTANRAGAAATYLYDPLGRRQAKIVNGVTTSFLSDSSEEVAEYTGAGALLRRYIPGPGTDQPIAMVTPAGASHTRSYFHVNRQGSTVAMSNDAGVMAEGPYTYDAYGQGPTSAGVPFKYTGRRLYPETGLYYYRARYYSSALGRFLQTDPIGYADDMNMYAYVGGDPVNNHDPSGHQGHDIAYAMIAIGQSCEGDPVCEEAAQEEFLIGYRAGVGVGLAVAVGILVPGPEDAAVWVASGVWRLAPVVRGMAIHDRLGANLPKNFPTIDKWSKATNTITSIKTIDTSLRTYQDVRKLRSSISRMIDNVADFRGATFDRVTVPGVGVRRALELAVPKGAVSREQRGVFDELVEYGKSRGVDVKVREVAD